MNKFDSLFFAKYIPKESKVIDIAHKHIIVIIDKILLNYIFWVILPTFIYYNSLSIQSLIPFFVLEIFILCIYLKNIYDIFNWYNDVWIITNDGVIELQWTLFSSTSVSVKYQSVEWLEIIQNWIIDTILWKWDIIIHKIGWENNFLLPSASRAYEILEKIESILKKEKSKEEEENAKKNANSKEKNFETILEALSWVVWDYIKDNWYKKDDSEEKVELIKKIKEKKWTIDLS